METINVNPDTKNTFERLRLDLKIKEKKYRTQDELLILLINFYKDKKRK